MIRKILFGMALIAGLVSCKGDYDDWATPQHNDGFAVMDELEFMVQPTVSTIDFSTETATSIQLFTSNLQADGYSVTIYNDDSDAGATIIADYEGYVSIDELVAAIESVFGSGEETYNVNVKVATSYEIDAEGSPVAIAKEAAPFSFTAKFQLATGPAFDSDPVLYLTGDHYNWGNPWVPLVPVNGYDNVSWIIIYLHEGEQFKFAPQAGWGGDFGMGWGTTTVVDNAGMNPSGDDNVTVGNAGWYLITVFNTSAESRTIVIDNPNVYLIGEGSPTSWSVGTDGLFTTPTTETGKFVSPAFVKDAEARMCVSLNDLQGNTIDWWRTEFVVRNGQIVYRGNGGDQERVSVAKDKKCYLDFTKGIGSYK